LFKVTDFPDVTTISNARGQLFVAVDQCLTALSEDSPIKALYTLAFDSKVTFLSHTPQGEYLFIGLQKGTLLCIDSATSEKVLSL